MLSTFLLKRFHLITSIFAIYTLTLATSMAGMEIASSLIAAIFLYKWIRHQLQQVKIGPDWFLLGYFVCVVLSASINSENRSQWIDMVGWMRWAILVYAFPGVLRLILSKKMERWHLVYCFLLIAIGFNSVFQFFTGIDISRPHLPLDHIGPFFRASGFFKMGLTFAYSIGMMGMTTLALSFQMAKQKRNKEFILSFLAYLSVGLSVLLSMTRGAWVAYAVASLLGVVLVSRRWFLKYVPVFLGVVTVVTLTNQTLIDRFNSIFDGQNFSNATRSFLWRANFLAFKDHPWFGIGFHQKKEMILKYYADLGQPDFAFFGHPHSDLLQMLVGLGIFGFGFYLALNFWFLRASFLVFKNYELGWFKTLGLSAFLGQVYFHIGGLTQCNFTDGEVNHMLIFLWAITTVLYYNLPNPRTAAIT